MTRRKRLGAVVGGILLVLAGSAPVAATDNDDLLPAFPGAEGLGKHTTGGRGGDVYIVTNLNDSGPGSFRDAVGEPNRYVVFAVGGIIEIQDRITVAGNVTIAGQTAPGGGITIYGNGLSFSGADNTIVRYLRIRQGINGDAGADAVTVAYGDSMVFDHVSVSWGRDEVFSASAGDLNKPLEEQPSNITVQDSIIAQGLDDHSAGSLMESEGGISLLRNLYIDNNIRSPKVKGRNQYVNNVIYNWRSEAYILGGSEFTSRANVQHNYFIAGPESEAPPFVRGNLNFQLYAENNVYDGNRNGEHDGYVVPREEYTEVAWVDEPFDYPEVGELLSPAEAYDHVVAEAGASLWRDRVDHLLIDELESLGTRGTIISDEHDPPVNGPGPIPGGRAPKDSSGDGMPDWWKVRVGLDPQAQDHNGDRDGDGYTNLEEYMNWLADRG